MHEHVFVLTADVQQNYPDEWGDEDERVADAVRRLRELPAHGISTIVDVTVIGQGRNIPRIKRIAEQVPELNIVVATGVYTFDAVPLFFWQRPRETMTEFFVRDITEGIAGTGVKAGMLKCAVDAKGLTEGVERVLRVGAPAPTSRPAARRSPSTRTPRASTAPRSSRCSRRRASTSAGSSSATPATRSATPTTWRRWPTPGSPWAWTASASTTSRRSRERSDLVAEMCRRGYAGRMVLAHDTCCYIDWFGPGTPRRPQGLALPARQPGRPALPARARRPRVRHRRDARRQPGPHPRRITASRSRPAPQRASPSRWPATRARWVRIASTAASASRARRAATIARWSSW